MAAVVSDCCVCCDDLHRLDLFVVYWVPCCFCFTCPISVASSTGSYLLIAADVKPGHPLRQPELVASINLRLGWDPKLAW